MKQLPAYLTRLSGGLFLIFALSGFTALEALFAPKAELWERWVAHDDQSTLKVDHGVWDRFLQSHVHTDQSGLNRIDYGAVPKPEFEALKGYIASLEAIPVTQISLSEQRAFWINAYNALTVSVILEHYPVKTIRDIDLGSGFFSDGPWGEKMFKIEGEDLSLNDIEHRILRPIWKDPRIHYAVNCASIGCPNIQRSAFTAELAETMLEDGATTFVNAPRNVVFANGKMTVSKIYRWFQDDFGGSEAGVLKHLRAYANQDLFDKMKSVTAVSDYTYNWDLNGLNE